MVCPDGTAVVVEALARKNWNWAAKQITKHQELFGPLTEHIQNILEEECKKICSPFTHFMLANTLADSFKAFSFQKLQADFQIFFVIPQHTKMDMCTMMCIMQKSLALQPRTLPGPKHLTLRHSQRLLMAHWLCTCEFNRLPLDVCSAEWKQILKGLYGECIFYSCHSIVFIVLLIFIMFLCAHYLCLIIVQLIQHPDWHNNTFIYICHNKKYLHFLQRLLYIIISILVFTLLQQHVITFCQLDPELLLCCVSVSDSSSDSSKQPVKSMSGTKKVSSGRVCSVYSKSSNTSLIISRIS